MVQITTAYVYECETQAEYDFLIANLPGPILESALKDAQAKRIEFQQVTTESVTG